MKKAVSMLIVSIGLNLSIANPTKAINIKINFDDLTNQPAQNGTIPFEQANGSKTLNGVTFENSPNGQPLNVTGDQYRVDSVTPGPTFGAPHSGNYFLSNRDTTAFLTTSLVLTEAWFGRVEYYGYGGGATSVTVVPLGVNGSLDPGVTVSLLSDRDYDPTKPGANGLPGLMVKMDTSRFLNLQGITGYRLDLGQDNSGQANWAADDFTFTSATPVPWETDALSVIGSTVIFGLGLWGKQKFAQHQKDKKD